MHKYLTQKFSANKKEKKKKEEEESVQHMNNTCWDQSSQLDRIPTAGTMVRNACGAARQGLGNALGARVDARDGEYGGASGSGGSECRRQRGGRVGGAGGDGGRGRCRYFQSSQRRYIGTRSGSNQSVVEQPALSPARAHTHIRALKHG
jgi:hypothetical protein